MDRWDEGDGYEPYVGRWSRLTAGEFLVWLGIGPGSSWLDVGCGTGALISTIIDTAAPRSVTGVDSSAEFLATTRRRLGDGIDLRVADARDLPFGDREFDAVVSGLVLNFIPEPETALREMRRVTAGGGTVAVYVWDYAAGMEFMRYFWDAVIELDSAAQHLDEGIRFPMCQPAPLAELFAKAGFRHVVTQPVDVPTVFAGFDDFWVPFLGGQGPAPGYVASLSDESRIRLRESLRRTLPTSQDGTIHLTARAWAVSGTN